MAQLIDWSEQHPQENAFQITARQSTVCMCGQPKEIGESCCGAHAAEYFNPEQGDMVAW